MRVLALLLLVMVCGVAQATVHHVPSPYSTIQAAVDAAADGDTVQVAAGVYTEAVTIDGKGINLFGDGSEVVTIDADTLSASCVMIKNPSVTSSTVRGLTLYRSHDRQGGVVVWNADAAIIEDCCVSQCAGSGIYVYVGSATIRRNRIAYNAGGIGGSSSTILIHDNLITGNVSGGVHLRECAGELRHNTIVNNQQWHSLIGGVQSERGVPITLVDNIVAFNWHWGVVLAGPQFYLIEHNDVYGHPDGNYVTLAWTADIGGSATNISADPLLLAPDYLPQAGSPVIGAASDGGNMGLDAAVAGCSPLVIDPVCGNGQVEFGEQCDGDTIGVYWCDSVCRLHCLIAPGDVNADGVSNAGDVVLLVAWIFKGTAVPIPCDAAGEMNCDGAPTAADIIDLIHYVFKSQSLPCSACESPLWSSECLP